MKLKNKYVIGTHVMFYEIEMFPELVQSIINALGTVDNPENVTNMPKQLLNSHPISHPMHYDKISVRFFCALTKTMSTHCLHSSTEGDPK